MKVISILALLSISLGLTAQGKRQEVKNTANSYFSLIEERNISQALDYIYPEFLDLLGKETFENMFNQIFNAPGVDIGLGNFKIDSVSPSFKSDERLFVLVKYNHDMTYKVDMSKDTEGLLASILLSSYQSKFGKENVTFEAPETFIINVAKDMYAIQSPAYTGWKVIEYEATMSFFLDKIIPEEVVAHFKH